MATTNGDACPTARMDDLHSQGHFGFTAAAAAAAAAAAWNHQQQQPATDYYSAQDPHQHQHLMQQQQQHPQHSMPASSCWYSGNHHLDFSQQAAAAAVFGFHCYSSDGQQPPPPPHQPVPTYRSASPKTSNSPSGIQWLEEAKAISQTLSQETIRDLEHFAEAFKQRRVKLGFTQADVGRDIAQLNVAGMGSLSQSTICRFESLTLSHNNMLALRPILEQWLLHAEEQYEVRQRSGLRESKRRRTSIGTPERRSLEAYFAIQSRPSSEKIGDIAQKLGLKKSVVRVWFCNQRQKQKRIKINNGQSELPHAASALPKGAFAAAAAAAAAASSQMLPLPSRIGLGQDPDQTANFIDDADEDPDEDDDEEFDD